MHIQRIQIHADRFPTRERYPFSLATLQQTRELTLASPIVYQDTDHYRVFRDFMADPRGYAGDTSRV